MRGRREAAGISLATLSSKAGIAKGYLSVLERAEGVLGPVGARLMEALDELDPAGRGIGVASLLRTGVAAADAAAHGLRRPATAATVLVTGDAAFETLGALLSAPTEGLRGSTLCVSCARGLLADPRIRDGVRSAVHRGFESVVVTQPAGPDPSADLAETVAATMDLLDSQNFHLRVCDSPPSEVVMVAGAGGAHLYRGTAGEGLADGEEGTLRALVVPSGLSAGIESAAAAARADSRPVVERFACEDERVEFLFAATDAEQEGDRHVLKREPSVVFMGPEVLEPYLERLARAGTRGNARALIAERLRRIERFERSLMKHRAIDVASREALIALAVRGEFERDSFRGLTGVDYVASPHDRRAILERIARTLERFEGYHLALLDDEAMGNLGTMLFTKGGEGWVQAMREDGRTIAYYLRTREPLLIRGLSDHVERLWRSAPMDRKDTIAFVRSAMSMVPTG